MRSNPEVDDPSMPPLIVRDIIARRSNRQLEAWSAAHSVASLRFFYGRKTISTEELLYMLSKKEGGNDDK